MNDMRHISKHRRPRARTGWSALGLALAVVGLWAAGATPAWAQSESDLLREIERTDLVIERAQQVVSSTDNALAGQYLQQASELQAMAKGAFSARLFLDAARLTTRARERAFAAIRIAEQAGSAEFLRFMLERTAALLDRIAPLVRASDVEAAHRLLDAALEQQQRALEAIDAGQPRAALSLTMQARERAMRALRLSEIGDSGIAERARRSVERTEELLADAAWLTESGDKAARNYEAAVRMNAQAQIRLEAGQYQAALNLSLQARERLVAGLNQASRPLDREQVGEALERTRDRVERAEDRAESDREREAVSRARERLERAARLFERDDLAGCLGQLRAVRGILEAAGL